MRHVSAVNYFSYDRIGDVIVSVFVSNAVDYKIGICCFSVKQAALRR